MATHINLLSCLLWALTVLAQDLPWPYNLPPHMKYYPEEEALVRRNLEIAQRIDNEAPTYVKKMSGDPNEKFLLDFWSFEGDESQQMLWYNQTAMQEAGISFPLHAIPASIERNPVVAESGVLARHQLMARDFGCPADTFSCTSISRPNICCPNGSTCQIVPDNGLGDVGCCPASQVCAGSLSQCPQGYTSCPNNPGGGCCLPGYACFAEGCVMTSTTIVVITPTTTTTTTTIATTTIQTTSTTVVTTTTPNTLVCSSGFRSCPASLGGGCCPTDRACGSVTCPEITTSASLSAPIRPTTASTTSSAATISGCPTGFYACSAYHQGGCCQVGRDCASTSCPATASETIVATNGITAVAPSGTYLSGAGNTPEGTCASGWSSCATTVGGGCCPTGYACGTMACSATGPGGAGSQVGKEAPRSMAAKLLSNTLVDLFLIVFSSIAIFMI